MAVNMSIRGMSVEECLDQTDAASNILTFEKPVYSVEIFHDEATPQTFIVNGISIKVASGGWRSPIAGIPSVSVTIPASVDCIVLRLV